MNVHSKESHPGVTPQIRCYWMDEFSLCTQICQNSTELTEHMKKFNLNKLIHFSFCSKRTQRIASRKPKGKVEIILKAFPPYTNLEADSNRWNDRAHQTEQKAEKEAEIAAHYTKEARDGKALKRAMAKEDLIIVFLFS
ncbi:unnamed protein product [Caenorhabditis brenneri]